MTPPLIPLLGLTRRLGGSLIIHPRGWLEDSGGFDIRTVQELLGHSDVKTTMIYTHLLNRRAGGVRSPVDGL